MNLKGKRVLVRVDLNSPVINGKVFLNDRIVEHAKTLKWLSKEGAKVVVLAHQGRKNGDDFVSLNQHSKLLNKFLKVKFVSSVFDKKAVDEINKLKNGEVLLLENVRFFNEESKPGKDNKFVKVLSPLFDLYINDALSVCLHEDQASVISFPQVLKSMQGPFMKAELRKLEKVRKEKGFLYVVGGKKIDEVLTILEDGLKTKSLDKVIATGIPALIFLIAKGIKIGKHETKIDLKDIKRWKELSNKLSSKLILPVDFIDEDGKVVSKLPCSKLLLDIGPKSLNGFEKIILNSKKIVVKGTPGVYEDERFKDGTKRILESVAKSKWFSVVLGGDTTSALKLLNIDKSRFSFVSLSGGTALAYLAGQKLKGVEVLGK